VRRWGGVEVKRSGGEESLGVEVEEESLTTLGRNTLVRVLREIR